MKKEIREHYRQYSLFTYPGLYEAYLRTLPDAVEEIGKLVRANIIHRTTLEDGNTGTNADLKYGDMTKVPWWRQAEDDYLVTAAAMLAELFRRDPAGLTMKRSVEDKIVVTCRFVAILMASILKAKGIPARVRSGFGGYFENNKDAWDHWITQYWNDQENRWITIDVDGSRHKTGFDMYDMPEGTFDFAAETWLNIRRKQVPEQHFKNAGGEIGLLPASWELFYDFHCLMNNEIIYLHAVAATIPDTFAKLPESTLQEIDHLAELMTKPDENFDELQHLWETKKDYRLLTGALL